MSKSELIKEMMEWAYTRGYNSGIDRGHQIAKDRYAESLERQFRLGQIAEAERNGDVKRILDLHGGIKND